jgi:hypothetical protein
MMLTTVHTKIGNHYSQQQQEKAVQRRSWTEDDELQAIVIDGPAERK